MQKHRPLPQAGERAALQQPGSVIRGKPLPSAGTESCSNAQEGKTGISEVHKPFPRRNITCVGLIENTEGTEWFALELKRCNRNCDKLKAPLYYLPSYSWRPHLYLNSGEEVIDCWNPDVRPGFELCQGNSAATPRSIFSSGLYRSDGAS